jgi:hypothetical protein
LEEYGLRKKSIAYVKDEKEKLNVMIITIKCVVSCEIMGLDEIF